MSRRPVATALITLLVLLPATASAEPLEPYLERSGLAEFAGQQVITCETPAGTRASAVELSQIDGVTTARSAAGGSTQVEVAGGSFSVITDEGTVDTSAALSEVVPHGAYTVSRVERVDALGRSARRVTVVDEAGLSRASMTFDLETGALLVSRVRNADGSIYCDIRMVEFVESPLANATTVASAASQRTLAAIDPPPAVGFPESVAGFSRVETFEWDQGGVVAYYSDGLFSFTLLATMRPVVLEDASAVQVTIDGGDYVRWFGAGQSIHVWDTELGGLTMYGDLPLDLQEIVLEELPDPNRIGVVARWWRNLFG